VATLLKGKEVADCISGQLLTKISELKNKGINPTLAIIRVGEKQSDLSYEKGAVNRCAKLGIEVQHFNLAETCTMTELLATIETVNKDDKIHGCLMFRPLPKTLDEKAACAALAPEKDVDCITEQSLAGIFTGNAVGYPPCTAQACIEILEHYGYEIKGKRVTVVGRSLVIGKPVAMMLLSKNATLTICHSHTKNIEESWRDADIIILAVGKPKMVKAKGINSKQVIIDVGINVDEEGKLCGDADFSAIEPIAGAITPVPGGVGAVTTSVLAKHVVMAAEKIMEARK